jgi:N-acetylglucosamine-6-phosphate deacetylase
MTRMNTEVVVLSGADLVLPDRIVSGGTLRLEAGRIAAIDDRRKPTGARRPRVDLHDHLIVPGFIDVHVHGVEGTDALESAEAIATMAARLPRYGVTAFCPTSLACAPAPLGRMLGAIAAARATPAAGSARVLPAHLESNFLNPMYAGAQPPECLRLPPRIRARESLSSTNTEKDSRPHSTDGSNQPFTGADILAVIDRARPDVGIVTLAPELEGAIDLIRHLASNGHYVSLGHSGASFEETRAAIDAGARQATHLFNRMTPVSHRAPGLAGAVLQADEIAAELMCDGVHVHPAMLRVAIAAKQASRVMAVTDGTAGSGLPAGSRAAIGGRPITVREAAYLDDGTLAGSVVTMDRTFQRLVTLVGLGPVDAALLCSTTAARELRLHGHGVIAPGAVADLVVLDRQYTVVQTWVAGEVVYDRRNPELAVPV